MKQERETIKKIIASMRKNRTLTNEYINPSMMDKKSTETHIKYQETRYIVDWQMRHTQHPEIPKINYASD